MDRRTFVSSASVVLGMAFSGCSAFAGSGSNQNDPNSTKEENTTSPDFTPVSENASFTHLDIGGPSNVTVGDNFKLPISATNVGAQNGTFSGRLIITEGRENLNRSIIIKGVETRETEKTVVESLNFTYADTYVFTIEGTDVTKTITVEPITVPLGEPYTLNNNLKVTVRSATFQPALFYLEPNYQEGIQTKLLSADSGEILMIVRLALENVSAESIEFDLTSDSGRGEEQTVPPLLVSNGNWYTSFPNSTSLTTAKNISGNPLTSVQLSPGAQTSGWLLAQVPRRVAKQTVNIVHQRDGAKTPPEIKWRIPPQNGPKRAFPKFTLDTFKMPQSNEIGVGVPYEVKVTNEGTGSGTFRGILEFDADQSQSTSEVATFTANLKSGESKTFKGTHKWWYTTSNTYHLHPFGKTQTVRMEPASLRYGHPFTNRSGSEITVSKPVVGNILDFPGSYAGPLKVGPSQQWVLAKVKGKIPDAQTDLPEPEAFTLRVGDYSYKPLQDFAGKRLTSPINGDFYETVFDEVVPGQPVTGYLVFKTPNDIPASAMSVQLKVDKFIDHPPTLVNWSTADHPDTE